MWYYCNGKALMLLLELLLPPPFLCRWARPLSSRERQFCCCVFVGYNHSFICVTINFSCFSRNTPSRVWVYVSRKMYTFLLAPQFCVWLFRSRRKGGENNMTLWRNGKVTFVYIVSFDDIIITLEWKENAIQHLQSTEPFIPLTQEYINVAPVWNFASSWSR